MLGLREDAADLVEERAARGGELDAAVGAVEQHDVQLALELADLLAERGLRDAQARRGAAEMQLLRDGQEVAEVAELHRSRSISQKYQSLQEIVLDPGGSLVPSCRRRNR